MVNEKDVIETLTLDLKDYMVSMLLDAGYSVPLKVEVVYRAEYMAYLLMARMRVPAQVLQEDKVVAEYPASLWDHIKKAVGMKYATEKVKLTEYLLYPTIEVPKQFTDKVRLYVHTEKER
jgi:hypothetical protein